MFSELGVIWLQGPPSSVLAAASRVSALLTPSENGGKLDAHVS
jgi:hypothetical protein